MAFKVADYRNELLFAEGDIGLLLGERRDAAHAAAGPGRVAPMDLLLGAYGEFLDAGVRILVARAVGEMEGGGAERLASGDAGPAKAGEAHLRAVGICRSAIAACSAGGWVFGTIGPPDGLLMLSELDAGDYEIACAEQAKRLADAGVDGLWVGGFAELEAMRIAVRAAVKATKLPVAGGMIFDSGVERNETALGVTIPQASGALVEDGASMIVVDSGESPDAAAGAVALSRQAAELPVWARVAAGGPEFQDGRMVYTEKPQTFAGRLAALEKSGALIIGGGRGVRPEHLAAMAGARKPRRGRSR